jgi:hypothetical protein
VAWRLLLWFSNGRLQFFPYVNAGHNGPQSVEQFRLHYLAQLKYLFQSIARKMKGARSSQHTTTRDRKPVGQPKAPWRSGKKMPDISSLCPEAQNIA